jgi:UDP-N-acetylmuramoyl-L-alanyl-D-glutamate--2,6-diaminopimelate ligase
MDDSISPEADGLALPPSQAILLLEKERLLLVDVPLNSPLRRGGEVGGGPLPLIWDTRALGPWLDATPPSPNCAPRFLFVARRGKSFDAHGWAQKVVEAGGLFVGHDTLTGHALESAGLPPEWVDEVMEHPHLLLVSSPDVALRVLLKAAARVSESDFTTLAVTGTNGKTSTVQILGHALARLSQKPVLRLGTLGIQIGDTTWEGSTPTMPDYPGFLKALRRAKAKGVAHIAMEATSHGLHQTRLGDWRVDVASFTNLSQDHLDYHGTMEEYAEAKAILFDSHLADDGTAVLDVDDPAWTIFADAAASQGRHVIGVGASGSAPEFFSAVAKKFLSARYLALARRVTTPSGIHGSWTLSSERHRISEAAFSLPLVGDFQHDNAAVAAASLVALGYPLQQVAGSLIDTRLIPGRLEPVHPTLPGAQAELPTVIVDYAHTPDALEKALHTCRALLAREARLFVVFGCGGDRDAGKRPLMGAIAARLADVCFVTSDNPRTEAPGAILSAIVAGVPSSHAGRIVEDADRSRAIRKAIDDADPGDLVLLAGKGHENYQIMGTTKTHFCDVEQARAALDARHRGRTPATP